MYPNLSQPFVNHKYASIAHIGPTICQNDEQIEFYRRKLKPTQVCNTTTE